MTYPTDTISANLRVAAYTAYPWEHVVPALRLVEPLRLAGIDLIQGNSMEDIDPDKASLADLVVIQRDFPRWEAGYQRVVSTARSLGKPIIYEVDDLLLQMPEDHPDRPIFYYSRAILPMLQAILDADALTCSTQALCDYLHPFNPNIRLLPNYLDDRIWPVSLPSTRPTYTGDERPVIIGYMGTTSHSADLEMLGPLLSRLLKDYDGKIAFHFWGIQPPQDLANLPGIEWTPLRIMDYAEFARYFSTQTCDIFIAPLTVNSFNLSKSPIKFLEYSALGTPGIYSSNSAYASIVRHGENGFLADNASDWSACLRRLVDEPTLRFDMGQRAHQTVQQNWLLSTHAHEWLDFYRQVMSHPAKIETEDEKRRKAFSAMLPQIREWQSELEKQVIEKDQAILNLKIEKARQAVETEALLQHQEQELQSIRHNYDELYNSRAVKLAHYFWRVKVALLPPGTSREQAWNKLTRRKPTGF